MVPPSVVVFNVAGIVAWLAAVYFGYDAVTMQTAVSSPDTAGNLQNVANLQLMHVQIVGIVATVGFAITGTLFLGFSAVVGNLTAALNSARRD